MIDDQEFQIVNSFLKHEHKWTFQDLRVMSFMASCNQYTDANLFRYSNVS